LVWRFTVATALLGAYAVLRRPGALRVPRSDVARYALLSLAGYCAASICFFFALRVIPASIAAILLYTYPAMVALADPLVGGPPLGRSRLAGVVLAFGGCVLVVDPFSEVGGIGLLGVLLGLGSAAGYANFSVLSSRLLPGRSRLVLMTYMFGFTAVAASAAALASRTPLLPSDWDPSVWLVLAAILVLPTFAAIFLYRLPYAAWVSGRPRCFRLSSPCSRSLSQRFFSATGSFGSSGWVHRSS
ncbi:MAG: DMT family transporter, partial [Coriobacteriia bacterium]|nr:DMT family transporter [Coriobacteriia bacterium]